MCDASPSLFIRCSRDSPDLREGGLTGRVAASTKVQPMVVGFRICARDVDLIETVRQSRPKRIDMRMPVAPKRYILFRARMLILHCSIPASRSRLSAAWYRRRQRDTEWAALGERK